MSEKNENQTNKKTKDLSSSFPLYMMCVLVAGMIAAEIYLTFCGKSEYKNVVVKNNKDKILVRDICTDKQERILTGIGMHDAGSDYKYLVPGDTIIVKADKGVYKNNKVLYYPTIQYNRDITLARQQRAKFNQIKDSVFAETQQIKR